MAKQLAAELVARLTGAGQPGTVLVSLIAHGDQHPINKINNEIIIPELKEAQKKLEVILYPGQPHGFYNGHSPTAEAGQKFFEDCRAFFQRHLPTPPAPLDEKLIQRVPVGD
jgi:acetyl esterase/lipase